jgi:hypothetical protein
MDIFTEILGRYNVLDNYNKYVFSFGTYENNSTKQTIHPFIKHNIPINDSIIFTMDERYTDYKDGIFPLYHQQKRVNCHIKHQSNNYSVYENDDYSVIIFMIPKNVPTKYCQFRGNPQKNFHYTFGCTPNSQWNAFSQFLSSLMNAEKYIYINNWAFYNLRYPDPITLKYKNGDNGHYFEHFPELGYILHKLIRYYKQPNLYITIIHGHHMQVTSISQIHEFMDYNHNQL